MPNTTAPAQQHHGSNSGVHEGRSASGAVDQAQSGPQRQHSLRKSVICIRPDAFKAPQVLL
eukprot:scaffold67076_cov22-Tisochrysis_lutea.AAC.3